MAYGKIDPINQKYMFSITNFLDNIDKTFNDLYAALDTATAAIAEHNKMIDQLKCDIDDLRTRFTMVNGDGNHRGGAGSL